jgi:hypothetical protein
VTNTIVVIIFIYAFIIQVDCSFRAQLFRMIRTVVKTISNNAALEIPLDAMTAVVRSLNGLLESMQQDLSIFVNSTNTTSANATNISFADGEQGTDSESGEPEPSVKSSTTTIEGGSCPTDLFDEGEELSQVMSDAINKATLKALSKHVPGESPLEVTFSFHVPLSRTRPCLHCTTRR